MVSSAVRDIDYDACTRMLWVTFVPTGQRYVFEQVPIEVYDAFIHAQSRGRFFTQCIRAHYVGAPVDPDLWCAPAGMP